MLSAYNRNLILRDFKHNTMIEVKFCLLKLEEIL